MIFKFFLYPSCACSFQHSRVTLHHMVPFVLLVELKEVLHVSKDDALLVDDSWRNLLNSTGHLPQVGLREEKNTSSDMQKQLKS